ncbi:MAG: YheC/YheD family protein [Bacillaceae bacterium]|nr:YheC/YheD family protein [Bacillaceae bacterium]
MKKTRLGIMTMSSTKSPPFAERENFEFLSRTGDELGVTVFVFFPRDVRYPERIVRGYRFLPSGKWVRKTFPLPDLIYDRYFYTGLENARTRSNIKRLKQDPAIRFLGLGLYGKWQIYQLLSRDPDLKKFVPHTERVTDMSVVATTLDQHDDIILKPVAGSLGKGVLRVFSDTGGWKLIGRNMHNHPVNKIFYSKKDLFNELTQLFSGKKYLVQPYLTLSTPEGEPFDIRILVQKGEQGNWSCTGMAVRRGQKGSVTSNLHGGGRACHVEPFLDRYYPVDKKHTILEKLHELINRIPPYIESNHGPLVELGMDVGVDREGNVWLIEVNSKPGRKVFLQLKEEALRKQALINPILYARHQMQCNTGG